MSCLLAAHALWSWQEKADVLDACNHRKKRPLKSERPRIVRSSVSGPWEVLFSLLWAAWIRAAALPRARDELRGLEAATDVPRAVAAPPGELRSAARCVHYHAQKAAATDGFPVDAAARSPHDWKGCGPVLPASFAESQAGVFVLPGAPAGSPADDCFPGEYRGIAAAVARAAKPRAVAECFGCFLADCFPAALDDFQAAVTGFPERHRGEVRFHSAAVSCCCWPEHRGEVRFRSVAPCCFPGRPDAERCGCSLEGDVRLADYFPARRAAVHLDSGHLRADGDQRYSEHRYSDHQDDFQEHLRAAPEAAGLRALLALRFAPALRAWA